MRIADPQEAGEVERIVSRLAHAKTAMAVAVAKEQKSAGKTGRE